MFLPAAVRKSAVYGEGGHVFHDVMRGEVQCVGALLLADVCVRESVCVGSLRKDHFTLRQISVPFKHKTRRL